MQLFFETHGLGKPLMLLHGFPFNHTIWNNVIGLMDPGIRIICPDLRGHGESKVNRGDYSISDMAEDLVHLLDRLQIDRIAIAGHSMGGYVALDFAQNYPNRISGLALISSHIYPDSLEKKKQRFESIKNIQKFGVLDALSNMPNLLTFDPKVKQICSTFIEKMDTIGAASAQFAMANRVSFVDVWQSLEVNRLVISGRNDQLVPIETSRKIADLSKSGSFVEIENAGHMPMLETPKKVAEALIKFIN